MAAAAAVVLVVVVVVVGGCDSVIKVLGTDSVRQNTECVDICCEYHESSFLEETVVALSEADLERGGSSSPKQYSVIKLVLVV